MNRITMVETMGEYVTAESRKVSVKIECYNAKKIYAVIKNEDGKVMEEYTFDREYYVTGYVIETILSTKVKYTITVTADKGTANERSVTDTLHVSLRGE